MPRCARMYIPNLPYHIVQRGNNREVCFIEAENYLFYLGLWKTFFCPFWSEQAEIPKMSTVKAQKTWHVCEFMANFTNKICVQSKIIKTGEQRCEKPNYPPMVPHDCRIVRSQ